MKIHHQKFVAAAGLGGILLFFGFILVAVLLVSSPDGYKRFHAWRMGGEYMGSEEVILQDKRNNCGPAALKMVFDHYGIVSTLAEIENKVGLTEKGSSMLALKEMAELKGMRAEGWRLTLEDFLFRFAESRTTGKFPEPVIVFVQGDHFAVVDSVNGNDEIIMRDPAIGKLRIPAKNLPRMWKGETLVFNKR